MPHIDTVPSNAVYVRFNVSPTFAEPIACINHSPSEYSEYKQPVSFALTSPVQLTKWDKLVKRDGVWGWSVWQLINTFNGSEEWHTYNSNIYGYSVFRWDEISKGLIANKEVSICSHFRNKVGAWSNGVDGEFGDNRQSGDSIYFVTSVVEMGDVDGWKAWLQSNNIMIVTKASSEQSFHPLPDDEQELLNNLTMYYGGATLYNDQGCPMEIKYVVDPALI
jgi:hypothetical protein